MGTIEKITNLKNQFREDINIPFYFFCCAILLTLTAFSFGFLRNLEVCRPFELKQPDLPLLLYIVSIILGSIVVYKLVRYYFIFYTIDYLLIAFFVFGTVISLFLWQIVGEYFWPSMEYIITGELIKWQRLMEPELIVGRQAFWIGMFLLLLYTVRLRDWKNYNKYWKVLIDVRALDSIFFIIQDRIAHLLLTIDAYNITHIFTFNDYNNFYPFLSIGGIAKLIFGEQVIFNLGSGISEFFDWTMIPYYFLIVILITTPIHGKSRAVTISKIFWISFGLVQIIVTAIRIFLTGTGLLFFHQFFSVIQIFLLVGLILMLYYAPQVILITDLALFRAKKLYKVMENVKSTTEPTFSLSQFTDYRGRLKTYMDSIPSHLLDELKSKIKAVDKN